MEYINNRSSKVMLFLIWGIIFFLICSFIRPFFLVPYDPWVHVVVIKNIMINHEHFLFFQARNFPNYYWHFLWACVFKILHISSPFIMANIIFKVQVIICFICLYEFSKNILNIVFKSTYSNNRAYLINCVSFFCPFLFAIYTGTFSVNFQQSWVMWYCGTYQITLVFYLLAFSCFASFLFFKRQKIKMLTFVLLAILILLFHPLEFVFLLISVFICTTVVLVFDHNLKFKFNKVILINYLIIALIIFSLMLTALIKNYAKIAHYSFKNIWIIGDEIVNNLNKEQSTLSNNWYIYILPLIIIVDYARSNKNFINIKFLLTLFCISVIFTLIPMVPMLAGLFSFISKIDVYRFFYANFIFIFIPVYILYILVGFTDLKKAAVKTIFLVAVVALTFNVTLLSNIRSIINPPVENLSENNINTIKTYLKNNHLKCDSHTIFMSRLDIDFILAQMGCNVFANQHSNYRLAEFSRVESAYSLFTIKNLYPAPLYTSQFNMELK